MGIMYLIQDLQEQIVFYVLVLLLMQAAGVYYLLKIHSKIFKPKPNGLKAVLFGLLGKGLGQAYNGQLTKAILFISIYPLLLIVGFFSQELFAETNLLAYTFFGGYTLSLIDAGRSAKYGKMRFLKLKRQEDVKAKINQLLTYYQSEYKLAVDTNILMHEADLLVNLLEQQKKEIHMSKIVFEELDGLKKSHHDTTRKKAQLAFDVIEEYQRRGLLKIMKGAKSDEIRKYGLGHSSDERIIGTYLLAQNELESKFVFFSNDKGARIMARDAGLPVVEIS
ncbi:PIN domain-containing protein [Salisediminibacterium selenitireducens]|uniref:Nucleotide binding protein PINc n=1 Tax=Bacillus selenitireducens (strain ATCC 700615 / DSM 15326 / MLS10) TaxID=439292 RepID=D6XVZ2_BACIE|nr:PIN domain-containing protein [Salisediminibacterium selenitireducens]ADH97765.1 Nucleotide binding protein PINc [[Bacillus] selenitireducens MLS10]